jgi:uncharacterized protein (TIGR00290 family)
MAEGHDVRYLINLVSTGLGRDSFHGVKAELMRLQSEAAGISMIQRETTWDGYEEEFRDVMRIIREEGIEGLVTGDMDVLGHRQWVEDMCRDYGLEPLLPLWGLEREAVLDEFIGVGFEAVVVCVKGDFLGDEWLGRRVDRQFVADLESTSGISGVDICGEHGEYHSFVIDGPIFRQRITVTPGGKTWRDGYGFLDIDNVRLIEKVD